MKFTITVQPDDFDKLPYDMKCEIENKLPKRIEREHVRIEREQMLLDFAKQDLEFWRQMLER